MSEMNSDIERGIGDDDYKGPLLLDDTPWKEIIGGPKQVIINHFKNSEYFPEWATPTKAILLFGPPGSTTIVVFKKK